MLVDNNGKDLYVLYSISDAQSNADPRVGVPPFGPSRGIVVLHSPDAGQTWESHYAVTVASPGDPTTEPENAAIFPWGPSRRAGTVYVVYNSTKGTKGSGHYHQYYVYSKDKGKTWSKPVKLDGLPTNKGAAIYATGAAGAPGVLDVAWYETDNGVPSDDASLWRVHFAQVRGADTAHPKWTEGPVSETPNHKGGICLQGILCGVGPGSGDRSLLDFFELAINPVTGMAEIAYADNYSLGKDSAGNRRGEVMYARQSGGRSALK